MVSGMLVLRVGGGRWPWRLVSACEGFWTGTVDACMTRAGLAFQYQQTLLVSACADKRCSADVLCELCVCEYFELFEIRVILRDL